MARPYIYFYHSKCADYFTFGNIVEEKDKECICFLHDVKLDQRQKNLGLHGCFKADLTLILS